LICALVFAGFWGMGGSVAAQEIEEPGILIVRVAPGSPAAEAGLRRGNILLSVDGEAVNTVPDLMTALAQKDAGDEVELTYLHGDDENTVTVSLGEADGRARLGIVPFPSGGPMEFRFEGVPSPEGTAPPMLRFSMPEGVVIAQVLEGSAAEEAGLQIGDMILSVDGEVVANGETLVDLISGYAPGDTVTLEVRTGEDDPRSVEVTLGAREDDAERAFLGVQVTTANFQPIDPESMPFHFGMPFPDGRMQPMEGVLIQQVAEESPAAEAGLSAGDLITEVDGEAVATFEELREIITNAEPGDELTLTVRSLGMRMFRGDDQPADQEPRTVTVTLGENEEGNAYLGISAAPMRLRIQEGNPHHFMIPRPNTEDKQGMDLDQFFNGMPGLREGVHQFFRLVPGGNGAEIEIEPAPAQLLLPSTEL
jgi:S1-C subfamily serine protease